MRNVFQGARALAQIIYILPLGNPWSKICSTFPHGCFLKWWYPQNTQKWSFSIGTPMVVGYHHFRKPLHSCSIWSSKILHVSNRFWWTPILFLCCVLRTIGGPRSRDHGNGIIKMKAARLPLLIGSNGHSIGLSRGLFFNIVRVSGPQNSPLKFGGPRADGD